MKIALCCIAKCENLYLSEWVNYHLNLGFDHIYIYDNNDTDGERCEDVIGKENPNVTVLKYFIGKKQNGCETQIASYNDFYQRFGGKYDWVLYLDVDEFLVLNGYKNVCGYIKDITKPSTKSVRLNWKCYDDNDNLHYECLPVRERFTRLCEDETLSYYKKHFYRTKLNGFKAINVHYSSIRGDVVDCDGKYATYSTFVTSDTYSHNKAYIAHYATKSADEYYMVKKKRRGIGTGNDRLSIEHYFKYNKRTEEKERYLNDLFSGKVEHVDFEESKVAVVNKKPTEGINKSLTKTPLCESDDVIAYKTGVFDYLNVDCVQPAVQKECATESGISICITAFEAQDYIEECLNSVANQTWFKDHNNYEILVGVDGCDTTLMKVRNIMHKYKNLRVFMMDSNMGTYVTSNTIISLAKYDYVIRFDSDDIMYENLVSTIMGYTDYDIVRWHFDSFGGNMIERDNITYGEHFIKKNMFMKFGGYRSWRCSGDEEFIVRLSDVTKQIIIPKVLSKRRVHSKSLTQHNDTNFKSDVRNHCRNEIINMKRNGFFERNINLVTNNCKREFCAIIALTSWIKRINTVHKTINNIMETCSEHFKIVLTLCRDEFPNEIADLPDEIISLLDNERFEILWVDKNTTCFKKFLYTMTKYKKCPIISADDDLIYKYDYASELYNKWYSNRNCAISGFLKNEYIVLNKKIKFPCGRMTIYPPNSLSRLILVLDNERILSTNNDDSLYGIFMFNAGIPLLYLNHKMNDVVITHNDDFPLTENIKTQKDFLNDKIIIVNELKKYNL